MNINDPREPEEKTEEEMIRDAEKALYDDPDWTQEDEEDLRESLEHLLSNGYYD